VPFIRDPTVACRQLKHLRVRGKGIVKIRVRFKRSEVAAKGNVRIDIEELPGEKQHQVFVQQRADSVNLLGVQITQLQAFDFSTQRPGQARYRQFIVHSVISTQN
jgi:hypothetical protein